jgi:hypothetical protein
VPSHLGVTPPSKNTISMVLRRFHLAMTVVWALLVIPTVMLWRESVLWVALMSAWANIMAHFAAYMAGRTEQREMEQEGSGS